MDEEVMSEEVTIPGFTKEVLMDLAIQQCGAYNIIRECVRRGVMYHHGALVDYTGTPVHFTLKAYTDTRVDM